MKISVYAIYDKVAQVYQHPWVDTSDMTAARSFKLACQDNGTLFNMCPDDFILYRVATFNDKSGTFSECEMPVKILDGQPSEVFDDE